MYINQGIAQDINIKRIVGFDPQISYNVITNAFCQVANTDSTDLYTNENKNECMGYLLATNENKFVFSLAFSNTEYPGNMINLEGGAAEINRWTYLAMSYNSDTRKMKLAVDGHVYEKQVNGETEQIHSDLKYVPNLNRYNHTI